MNKNLTQKAALVKKFLILLFSIYYALNSFSQKTFPPPKNKLSIIATSTKETIQIDGELKEFSWNRANSAQSFLQLEPNQGEPANFQTIVKVLFNKDGLYIGAFCKDDEGRKGIRTPDLTRDFSWATHDVFGVTIDPFLDERNAQSFQTNPYGAQRDVLSTDNFSLNTDWNGLWKVRTFRTDSGWFAEIEIPWKTIRYPNNNNDTWGINFFRKARGANEISSWSPIPRAFNVYRMDYAGLMKGISPPTPSANIRLNPYLLTRSTSKKDNENDERLTDNAEIKAGGEIKWAITSNTILDATINTDFAQTDLDRRVINLSRFSIFFPEKRHFFLENSNIFSLGNSQYVQPFFSRTIGLDGKLNGTPIPIQGGLRLIHRSVERNYGAILIRQYNNKGDLASNFAVGRFSENIGKQSKIGGMITSRLDENYKSKESRKSFTYTADIFHRFNQSFSWQCMLSRSQSKEESGNGWAAYSNLTFNKNWIYAFLNNVLVDRHYNPEAGFISRKNFILTEPGFYFIYRPEWKPKFIRGFEPGIFNKIIHQETTGILLEWESKIFPLWVLFHDGSVLEMQIIPTYQYLELPFYPLNVNIEEGKYYYTRYLLKYSSDRSKKISGMINISTGNFYNGWLNSIQGELSISPVPHIYLSGNYTINQVKDLGVEKINKERHLFGPELRLAINPRIQLSTFYQIRYDRGTNNSSSLSGINTKLTWEVKPLSYIYLVYNNNLNQISESPQSTQQVVAKVTYLRQF